MNEKLIPLLKFIDDGSIEGVLTTVVERTFDMPTISSALRANLIGIEEKIHLGRTYFLTDRGYQILMGNQSIREQKLTRIEQRIAGIEQDKSNRWGLIIAILALLVAILAIALQYVKL